MKRRMRLGVQVDETNSLPGLGQRCAEIHGRGRFANAAFLIDDSNRTHGELSLVKLF